MKPKRIIKRGRDWLNLPGHGGTATVEWYAEQREDDLSRITGWLEVRDCRHQARLEFRCGSPYEFDNSMEKFRGLSSAISQLRSELSAMWQRKLREVTDD